MYNFGLYLCQVKFKLWPLYEDIIQIEDVFKVATQKSTKFNQTMGCLMVLLRYRLFIFVSYLQLRSGKITIVYRLKYTHALMMQQ